MSTVVPSPCTNVCVMQTRHEAKSAGLPQPVCKGCARTIDEIADWAQMSDDAKQAVWVQLEARKPLLKPGNIAAPA
jgi:predicted Fe-S protein YdhL (DUF1289 family)